MASSNTVFFSDDEDSFCSEDNKPQIQQTITTVVPPTYADETLDTQVLLKSWNIKRDIIETVVGMFWRLCLLFVDATNLTTFYRFQLQNLQFGTCESLRMMTLRGSLAQTLPIVWNSNIT